MNQNHRSYQNRLPVQSKLLAHKWDGIKYNIHRRRIGEVKKQVDNGIPYSMSLKFDTKIRKEEISTGKANPIDQEKQQKINQENKRLHSKMVEIDSKSGLIKYTEHKGPKRFSSFKNHHYKTEMKRVMKENERLLTRIALNEPIYNTLELEKDFDGNHSRFVSNITRYPGKSKLSVKSKVAGRGNNGGNQAGDGKLLEELETKVE